MSSVEGMWKFQSGSFVDRDKPVWGGIVVLESGRVFGGDSMMAYLGTFEMDRDQIIAEVRSWTWNSEIPAEEMGSVFGVAGPVDYRVRLEGSREGGVIDGSIWRLDQPEIKLRARMEKIADLP